MFSLCLYTFSLSVLFSLSMDLVSEINAFIHSFVISDTVSADSGEDDLLTFLSLSYFLSAFSLRHQQWATTDLSSPVCRYQQLPVVLLHLNKHMFHIVL